MFQPEDSNLTLSDEGIQNALRALFLGVVPERQSELEELWSKYQLEFHLLHDESKTIAEAGLYKQVRYSHRMLRAVWVSAFAAWEGYGAVHQGAVTGCEPRLERFRELIALVRKVIDSDNPFSVALPGLPEQGQLLDASEHLEMRLAAEFAYFAAAWVMLHEVRHIQHQQDATSSTWGMAEERHAEELSCDEFAIRFITDKVGDYAAQHNVSADLVLMKRKTGIYFALFAVSLIAGSNTDATDFHPAIQTRLDAVCQLLSASSFDTSFTIMAGAFAALKLVVPWAPTPSY
jgi:hypothetical protein